MSERWQRWRILGLLAAMVGGYVSGPVPPAVRAADDEFFRTHVAPVLQRRCLVCHNDEQKKGGLSLQSADSLGRGGDSGPVVVSGQPAQSLLLEQLSGPQPAMPKGRPPLAAAEVDALRQWVATGAAWPKQLQLEERPAADLDWWSLKPLQRPTPPSLDAADQPRVRNDIDRFIVRAVRERGLTPSPPADRATLIRRLYFDLTGLRPEPEDVEAFVRSTDPRAYELLVDHLLESPRYGERWARHWLDVVHYGDTHGYDKDKLRPNAWPYRDYVIRALNDDLPYGRFVSEQLAADVLDLPAAERAAALPALGFIAAGPWDFISHVEVPESKIDGKIARNLDRDDMVVNTLNTFCSLTVQCARCHHHKFDPVSLEDYYRLQAIFAALDRADLPYDTDPGVAQRRAALAAQRKSLERQATDVAGRIATLAGPELVEFNRRIAELTRAADAKLTVHPQFGYHSAIEPRPDVTKWVQVDLSEPKPLTGVELFPCHDNFNNIGAGFGFPIRYRIEASDDAEFKADVVVLVDHSREDVANPGLQPQRSKFAPVTRRFVRVTATRLAPRQNDYILALAELRVFDPAGQNVAAGRPVGSLDTIEAAPRWGRANLVDGHFPLRGGDDVRDELGELGRRRDELLDRTVPADTRKEQRRLAAALAEVNGLEQTLPPPQVVYAGMVYSGSGNFVGTGPTGGRPRPIHILARGDVRRPQAEVTAGVPPLFVQGDALFGQLAAAPESQRRLALAQWITHPDNPLTWRSIVNRVWQYHFGRGLVDSPSDFGRMGQRPSHPELLDWLAVEFRDRGQSLKQLHRLIVNSATYRQSSVGQVEAEQVDAGNTLLWRMNRRKLDAEAIRDNLLLVAGKLDLTMGGPGFQDFVIERPEHSPHFEYHLHDPEDPRTHRRSVYRFLVRSQPQPFMTTLDCADPSMAVDKRNETINSLQSLALLNNKLTIAMTRHFAARVEALTPDPALRPRLAFRLALSRDPTDEEARALGQYATEFGLANACRVLFNLNEFAFVD